MEHFRKRFLFFRPQNLPHYMGIRRFRKIIMSDNPQVYTTTQKRMEAELKQPLVTVIIPVHNAAKYLDECLLSILAQTYRPLEVSVYDDLSTVSSAM